MTNRTSLLSKIWLALSVVCAIFYSAFRTHMLHNTYDAQNGFYTDSELLSVFGYSLAALVVIFAVTAYIYIKEGNFQNPSKKSLFLKGASYLSAIVLCGFIIYAFAKAVIPSFEITGGDLAIAGLSAVAMLYFLTFDKKNDFCAILCIASSLVTLGIVLILYFDRSVSFVNHSVMLCFAACIFSALAFAAEANFALGRPAMKRYIAYAPAAIALSFTLAVPDIIFFAQNRVAIISDIYFDIIILAFGIYHIAHLADIAFNKEEK